jgi:hypothetical protein
MDGGMSGNTRVDEHQMSFFIHLWLETGERPRWRGRVKSDDGERSSAFEDEQTLLGFIRDCLAAESVVLPWRRSRVAPEISRLSRDQGRLG